MPIAPPRHRLVLASASPRRAELLRSLGLDFVIQSADIDETRRPAEPPEAYVERLANEKARAGATRLKDEPALVIAADTIVVHDGRVLGKPADEDDAKKMLRSIAGQKHEVLTGVCVVDTAQGRTASNLERTEVAMAPLGDGELSWYVGTGEPLDKAGSYAIQGLGAIFVERVRGNYTNVVGLPLPLLHRLASELGFDLMAFSHHR